MVVAVLWCCGVGVAVLRCVLVFYFDDDDDDDEDDDAYMRLRRINRCGFSP